jgi:hypothetical protein
MLVLTMVNATPSWAATNVLTKSVSITTGPVWHCGGSNTLSPYTVVRTVSDGQDLEELLSPHGFKYYLVRRTDLVPAARIVPDPCFRDWLFCARTSEQLRAIGVPIASVE